MVYLGNTSNNTWLVLICVVYNAINKLEEAMRSPPPQTSKLEKQAAISD